jgi:hypothetical protein
MQTAERERHKELQQERAEFADPKHAPQAQQRQFHSSGAVPAVASDVNAPGPSASERAYGGLPRELLDKVRSADEAGLGDMLRAYSPLGAPILTAIVNVHGQPTAQNVAKAAPPPDADSETTSEEKLPAGYDDGPIQVARDDYSDMQKVAGWNQITTSVVKEAHAPDHIRLPASVLEQLADLAAEGNEKDQEQGGNLVKTYGGKWEIQQTHDEADDNESYNVDTSDVGLWARHVGIVHTHVIDEAHPYATSFSKPDMAQIVDEDQPLNIVQSGNQIYVISRTKEFNAMVKDDPTLEYKMQDTWKAAYDAEMGKARELEVTAGQMQPAAVEKAVIAVCREFHLIYYWGQGQDLHRVR